MLLFSLAGHSSYVALFLESTALLVSVKYSMELYSFRPTKYKVLHTIFQASVKMMIG